MNDSWLVEKVPVWAHPRSPLVAISLRVGGPWEYRVNRFIDFVLTQVFSIWIIIFVFLPLFGALLFAAGWQFFSILTYVALTLSAPFMVFASEFFFSDCGRQLRYAAATLLLVKSNAAHGILSAVLLILATN